MSTPKRLMAVTTWRVQVVLEHSRKWKAGSRYRVRWRRPGSEITPGGERDTCHYFRTLAMAKDYFAWILD